METIFTKIKNLGLSFGKDKVAEQTRQDSGPVILPANGQSEGVSSVASKDADKPAVFSRPSSIVSIVNRIIENAYVCRASDVHIDPGQHQVQVRLRVDGVLQDAGVFAKSAHPEIISRIKILAGLRIDEHQAAQDGRFHWDHNFSLPLDVRVSIVPTYYGENAVLRLLSGQSADFNLEALGFSKTNRDKISRAAKKPYGMILATGPTGSGKTTTLYTLDLLFNND